MKDPGCPSSSRIRTLILVPRTPAHPPKIRYNVPMSLWFVEKNHRKNLFSIASSIDVYKVCLLVGLE